MRFSPLRKPERGETCTFRTSQICGDATSFLLIHAKMPAGPTRKRSFGDVSRRTVQRLQPPRGGGPGGRRHGSARHFLGLASRCLEGGQLGGLRHHAGPALHHLHGLPQHPRPGEGHLPPARLLRHLPAHRRQLHTLRASHAARPLGLDAVRRQLGPGGHRHHPGTVDRPPHAHPVPVDLRDHGLAGAVRVRSAHRRPAACRPVLAGGRRRHLYRRHRLLPVRRTRAPLPRHLAPFRPAGSFCQFVSILYYVG